MNMDEDEGRKRALEAGREMLEAYKAKRSNKSQNSTNQGCEISDEDTCQFEQPVELRGNIRSEEISSRDITHSSISMSEGEGDGDLEGMANRVAILEELLQGKEAMVEALHAEIDHLRVESSSPNSSQSQNSTHSRDIISLYHTKLQEFEKGIHQRDLLIENLTSSLHEAFKERDIVMEKMKNLTSMDISISNMESLQQKIGSLESALNDKKNMILGLNAQLTQVRDQISALEIEKETRDTEIRDYKMQIDQLNEQLRLTAQNNMNIMETMEQQKFYQTRVDKMKKDMHCIREKFTAQIHDNTIRHEQELKDLMSKHESEIKNLQQKCEDRCNALKEENKQLADRLNTELPSLESKHAKELSVFQSQLVNYQKTLSNLIQSEKQIESEAQLYKSKYENLKSQMSQQEKMETNDQHEKESLYKQIQSYKIQLETLTSKCVASTTILESKESIERSLEQALTNAAVLKDENDSLKSKLEDLTCKYSQAQSLIETNQTNEKTLNHKIHDLQKSLSRLSNVSQMSEFNETTYQNLDEHYYQYQLTAKKLEEKEQVEKFLENHIRNIEKQLEEAKLLNKSYEKELKDLRNTCDKFKDNHLQSIIEKQELELRNLMDKCKKSEQDTEHLKKGLKNALAQCSELEKQNQTLTLSRLESTTMSDVSFELKDLMQLDSVKSIVEENTNLKRTLEELTLKHKDELNILKLELAKEVKRTESLLMSSNDENIEWETLRNELENKHAQEMEELRTYFEQKCLQMEKQYSEEIFSQQSKKMSDNDSEIEELTEDLYFAGAGDCLNNDLSPPEDNKSSKTYQVELKNLKMEYDKRLEEQKHNYEQRLKDIEEKNERIRSIKATDQHCQTEWDVSALENGELSELRDAYRHQLEEQVALARLDICNSLQEQIQALLSIDEDEENRCPVELVELRNKLTNNAKLEIQQLKELHNTEITKLKEEYTKNLNKIIQRYEEQINHKNTNEERDNLDKTCKILKSLVGELIKYLAICEEEVNNALINQVFKRPTTEGESVETMKRVHFAPQASEIASIINNGHIEHEEFTNKLKKELNNCLDRLKLEIAQIFGIPLPLVDPNIVKKFKHPESMITDYQNELERLSRENVKLKEKLLSNRNKKEIVSEGYGEQHDSCSDAVVPNFAELQEKARVVLSNGDGDNPYLLQLIEELCRQSDKLMEDSRKEKDDLQKQVEAADKQLRGTRKFLEEQAAERESERDEFAKQIHSLKEELNKLERDKERDLRMTSETSLSPVPSTKASVLRSTGINVEVLECQLKELTIALEEMEIKKNNVESELKAAIDKIWVLRDIITDLEQQVHTKNEKEESLRVQISQLETVIAAQTKNQQELVQELDSIKMGSENGQLSNHITHLQEELKRHKLSSEHFNPNSPVLRQMKIELREILTQLDKKTKDLESMHMVGSNLSLSQPSEDVSIKEQIDATRCLTPDDPNLPPILPLDQILKLKEKLSKHARAEDVAFKRINDLEIQLASVKTQNEDLQAELEVLQQTASERLFQIEVMRGRLEQQKQNAPFVQRQATSRLELQLHEANTKVNSLERAIEDKNLEIEEIKSQHDRMNELMKNKEVEITRIVQSEKDTIQKLKNRLAILEEEKKNLELKIGHQNKTQMELPQLIDTMLADKNEEIDHLKEQLSKKDKQLDVYSTLTTKDVQSKPPEGKNSARTLSDILSLDSEYEEGSEAIRAMPLMQTTPSHQNVSTFVGPTMMQVLSAEPSLVELKNNSISVPLLKLRSNSESSNVSQHHQQQQTSFSMESLNHRADLQDAIIQQKEEELMGLKKEYEEILNSLMQEKQYYKNQYEIIRSGEDRMKNDIKQLENTLKSRMNDLQEYKDKIQVNEKILMELSSENGKLKNCFESNEERYNEILQEKTIEVQNLQKMVNEKEGIIKNLTSRTDKCQVCEQNLLEYQKENQRLADGLNNRDQVIRRLEEMARRNSCSEISTSSSNDKDQEIHHLQEYLKEKDKVIRQMSDDSKSLYKSLETIQNKIKESGNVIDLRKKLKEQRRFNTELIDNIEKLKKEISKLKSESNNESQDESDIENMLQRELNLSERLDRQLLNVIESESETSTDSNVERDRYERIIEKYNDIKIKYKQGNKMNEELMKLKDELEIEKDMLRSQVLEYEHRVLQIKSDLENEFREAGKLDQNLSEEKNKNRTLQMEMDKLRRVAETTHMKDTEYIQVLQEKLQVSLATEDKLRSELAHLRQEYKHLEIKLISVKEEMKCQKLDQSPAISDLKLEQAKYFGLLENYEKEQRNNIDLQNNLKHVENERFRYQSQLEIAREEKEKLLSSLALVEGVKEHLETDLKRKIEEVSAREDEIQWLQLRIKTLTDADAKKQQQRTSEYHELKTLRKTVNDAREFMIDLESKAKQLRKELTESLDREKQMNRDLEAMKEKGNDLEKKLLIHKQEELRLKEIIQSLEKRIKYFEATRKDTENVAMKFQEMNGSNVPQISQEKHVLLEKLTKITHERDELSIIIRNLESQIHHNKKHIDNLNLSKKDILEKLQHFYGKYLRVDSKRRALAFQKRYLICVLGSYQISEENTLIVLSRLTLEETLYTAINKNRRNPKVRFRSAVCAVIAIHRMKWLIVRWRTGRRAGANAILGTLNHLFSVPQPRVAINHSPPVREAATTNIDQNLERHGFNLTDYYERLRNIQQSLYLATSKQSTD